jgi:hypothetical protein
MGYFALYVTDNCNPTHVTVLVSNRNMLILDL